MVFAGLVFSALTDVLMDDLIQESEQRYRFLRGYEFIHDVTEDIHGQLVVLLDHLPSDISQGYDLDFSILLKVNGQPIRSMESLLASIVDCEEKLICFSLVSSHL